MGLKIKLSKLKNGPLKLKQKTGREKEQKESMTNTENTKYFYYFSVL